MALFDNSPHRADGTVFVGGEEFHLAAKSWISTLARDGGEDELLIVYYIVASSSEP